MILIPKSVVFFILGFISAFIVMIVIAVVGVRQQRRNEEKLLDKFLESLNNKDDGE